MDAETREMFELVLTEMRTRFDTVDQRFTDVDRRFDVVDHRFEKLETRFDTLEQGFAAYLREFFKLRLQVDRRFTEVDRQVAILKSDMYSHFDTLYLKMGDVRDEYKMITLGLRRLQLSTDTHARSIEELSGELTKLRAGYDRISARLDKVEAELRGDHDA